MSIAANRKNFSVLPFHNQTSYDIEVHFQTAKRKITELMSNNGLLDFMKENNLNELCDMQYLKTCQYFDEDEFIKKGFNSDNYLNIFSMNIRSLPRHGGELTLFLNMLQTKFDIIVLCEIGARTISTVDNMLGITFIMYCHQKNNFGGVVYTKI